jgi:hypothetical protein
MMTVSAAPSKTIGISAEMIVDSAREALTWASMLGGLNCWRFTWLRWMLARLLCSWRRLPRERLARSLRKEAENGLEGFSLAIFDPAIENEAKEFLTELMKTPGGFVLSGVWLASVLRPSCGVVLRLLRLASYFNQPPTEDSALEDLRAYVDPARKVLAPLIPIRDARSQGVTLSHVVATGDQLFTEWTATSQPQGSDT